MKKIISMFISISLICTMSACSSTQRDEENNVEMDNGQVVEVEGEADQYGWMPHLRLTFEEDILTEVYFDYINEDTAKKSQDEEYNATMQEKTGTSVKDAMEILRANLLEVQSPEKVDIVTGATQTSTEFVEMAVIAYDNYFEGKTSANNYGEGDPVEQAIEDAEQYLGEEDATESGEQSEDEGSSEESSEGSGEKSMGNEGSHYMNGGDANPNNTSSNEVEEGMW